jgi:hypothetical protein
MPLVLHHVGDRGEKLDILHTMPASCLSYEQVRHSFVRSGPEGHVVIRMTIGCNRTHAPLPTSPRGCVL